MSARIFYYSRSGNCAKVANSYAKETGGQVVQILDIPEDRYWGTLGFIKGALNTVFKKMVSYKLVGDRAGKPLELILITPIWAGKIPAPFLTFLLKETFDPTIKITVVTVSDSGKGRNTFRQIVNILQQYGVQEIRHKNLRSDEI